MHKKILISFLLVAIFNLLVGCYSSELITTPEYNQIEEKDKPDDIRLTTKDSQEYHFSKSNVYIENDTLYGKGEIIFGDNEKSFDGKFALSDIVSIEFENINWLTTSLLVLGIAAILGGVFLYLIAANMNIK